MKIERKTGVLRWAIAGLTGLMLSALPMASAGASAEVKRLQSLETQAAMLSGQARQLNTTLAQLSPVPPLAIGENAPIIVAQSSRDVASINVRLGQLEEQIRILTGQVEGLQFQMTQMQTLLQRMQEDYEFRFQALEGGGLGKTSAAPLSGSDTLTVEVPQLDGLGSPDTIDLTSPDIVIDPVAEGFELGLPEQALGTLESGVLDLTGQPLDLSFDPGGLVTDDDASAQYRAGYDAVARGDYAFAEDQFRQFVALFPAHQQAPDATNWLGEALMLRGAHDEAAEVFLSGFQNYSNSTRAPDLLLNLGIALSNAGERDTACRTFGEVPRRYPNEGPEFLNQVSVEAARAQC